jgi:hypothetical protein
MTRPRKPRLVADWRNAASMWSVRIAGVATVFGLLPADQQGAILEALHVPANRVPAVMGALFIVARLWAQQPTPSVRKDTQ